MTPLAEALNTALLHFLWQGIAVACFLWVLLFMMRRSSPNARYVAACAALGLLALAPVLTAWAAFAPEPEVPLSWKAALGSPALQGASSSQDVTSVLFSGIRSLEAFVLPLWGLGVSVFALRLVWCWAHTSALRRSGSQADNSLVVMVSSLAERIGVKRGVRVLMSSLAEVPSVIGGLRPVLLLPVAVAAGLTPEQLEAIIAHELAHIRRHDYFVNLMQTVVETVLFYHPAVWWVSRKIRYERELCCDDMAIAAVGDVAGYARALAKLEQLRILRPSLAMGAADGPLFHRIDRLLGGDGRQEGPLRLLCAVGLLAGVVFLGFNMSWAQGQQVEFVPPTPSYVVMLPMPSMLPMRAVVQDAPVADIPWVLFVADRVTSSASPAEHSEARAARQSAGGGDLLWFRMGGKAYASQDKETIDRLVSREVFKVATAEARQFLEAELQKAKEQQAWSDLRLAEMSAQISSAEAELALRRTELARVPVQLESSATAEEKRSAAAVEVRTLDNRVRASEARLAALNGYRDRVQREVESGVALVAALSARLLEAGTAETERQRGLGSQITVVIESAVRSGKARPLQ